MAVEHIHHARIECDRCGENKQVRGDFCISSSAFDIDNRWFSSQETDLCPGCVQKDPSLLKLFPRSDLEYMDRVRKENADLPD